MVSLEVMRPDVDEYEIQPQPEGEAAFLTVEIDAYVLAVPDETVIAQAYAEQERDRAAIDHVNTLASTREELAADIADNIRAFTRALTRLEQPSPWIRPNVAEHHIRDPSIYSARRHKRSLVGEHIVIDLGNFGVPAQIREDEADRLRVKQRKAYEQQFPRATAEEIDVAVQVTERIQDNLAPMARRRKYLSTRHEEKVATEQIADEVVDKLVAAE